MKKIIFLYLLSVGSSWVMAQEKIRVLFIGNSLTYYNNLPELIKKIASADGHDFKYTTIAKPDYALLDHWNEGKIIEEIQTGRYHFVVVQQGPSAQAEGRAWLMDAGLRLAELCRKHQAKLAFYMVWPSKTRSFDFQGVIDSYTMAADSAGGVLCPAGSAWKRAGEINPGLNLYDLDNFHPNYAGSFLSALVIYNSLVGKTDFEYMTPKKLEKFNVPDEISRQLIRAAEQVLNVKPD